MDIGDFAGETGGKQVRDVMAGVQRRGTVYLVVMSTTVLATVIAVTGLAIARMQGRAVRSLVDRSAAREGALSALQLGAAAISMSSTWRSEAAAASGVLATLTYGQAQATLTVSDPHDGNLTNNLDDPIELVAWCTVGGARQAYRARLVHQGIGLSCLDGAIVVSRAVTIDKATVMGSGKLVGNDGVEGKSARIALPVEASGTIKGGVFESGAGGGFPVRTFPGAPVFDSYKQNGREIPLASIPSQVIERVVLSPGVNPFGSGTNERGVYWIDCKGSSLTIQNCRIVGTLVVLNCGTLRVAGSVNWEPAIAGMPVLLSQGKMDVLMTRAPLSESALAVNFNPPSTAYNGSANTTAGDQFPSVLRGLVYVTADVTISGECVIHGALVAGSKLDVSGGSLTVFRDEGLSSSPPRGFRSSTQLIPVAGTFARVIE